jgi:RND family efflux transporter MFP subunit
MKPMRRVAAFALLVLCAGAAVLWRSRAIRAQDAVRAVSRIAGEARPRSDPSRPIHVPRSRFIGALFSRNRFEVNAAAEGTVRRLDVSVGEAVRRGSVLAMLESTTLEADLQEAHAALRIARADRQRRWLEVREGAGKVARVRAMAELVSAADLDASEGQLEMAKAQLEGAEGAVAAAAARVLSRRNALEATTIRAPFDCVVAAKFAERGSFAHVGTSLLRIVGAGDVSVRFAVPEDQIHAIAVGQRVAVEDPHTGERLLATVGFVAPEVDRGTRAVFVEASFDPPAVRGSRLLVGVQVSVLAGPEHARADSFPSAGTK